MYIPATAYLSKKDYNFFYTLLDLIMECLKCVVYYDKLKEAKEKYQGGQIIWYSTTLNAYQQVAVMKCSNLFKVPSNEQVNQEIFFSKYYNPVFGEIEGKKLQRELLDRYDKSLTKYRDRFVAHRDYKYLHSAENNLKHPYVRPIGSLTWSLFITVKKVLEKYHLETCNDNS